MPELKSTWQLPPSDSPPADFLDLVQDYAPEAGQFTAQLLWQRGILDELVLAGFLNPDRYTPSSPFEFQEMSLAVTRLQQALEFGEKVAIWGDFDADGITATAVLWEGLGQFFAQEQHLVYLIPNRLHESHGLSLRGIDDLKAEGCTLIVTCDTGSTNQAEIDYAGSLGLDVIVTDHHTLPAQRPSVVAILNPREFETTHPLAHLSGVAVAYKLVEALYLSLPDIPQQPLETLLDLVAIGLIADLVQLRGDCRYLAQRGIARLQNQLRQPTRPGVAKLLELCRKTGDRPTDISFGLGPRINAVSRIQGDARFCVELLTSQDAQRCQQLALETELANSRRKSLQKETVQQAQRQLEQIDLSTSRAIVLVDNQWPVGILGLVAGQIAQEYGRPTILLQAEDLDNPVEGALAKGSARSVQQIDLYTLFAEQSHLLHSYGGHPLAAGLSLPITNIPLFIQSLNQRLSQNPLLAESAGKTLTADLVVTVADLIGTGDQAGHQLFRQLRLLEPCGMGNPVPRLLIKNCWFARAWNQNISDSKGRKLKYIKTSFELWDETAETGFPGIWWEHYKEDLPQGRADAIVELDYNSYENPSRGIEPHYELRLLAVRDPIPEESDNSALETNWILDWRSPQGNEQLTTPTGPLLKITSCPQSWDELRSWFRRALREQKQLAIAYSPPAAIPAETLWQQLVGMAKYLSRTGQVTTYQQIQNQLGIGPNCLNLGLKALEALGFEVKKLDEEALQFSYISINQSEATLSIHPFLKAIQEEQFRRQYFYQVPVATIQAIAQQSL